MQNKIKGRLGFGCMRLPMTGEAVNNAEFSRMIDAFMNAGFNYFDTAQVYLGGKSETALRECLTERYPREDYFLTDKLTVWCVKSADDIRPFFMGQLKILGIDYLDLYLFHALNESRYELLKEYSAFETVRALRDEGKIKHIGLSFHDTPEVLDRILCEQSDIEVVQLQINYLDYDDPRVESKRCYDVAVKHGKKVIVMEPVKGGVLANLPSGAAKLLSTLGEGSQASFALRYAASFPEVIMVLSGMGSDAMMADNIRTMSPPLPYSASELEVISGVRELIRTENLIPCTACNYCGEVCPQGIRIPDVFSAMNSVTAAKATPKAAREAMPSGGSVATSCIECGMCESVCPQKIAVRDMLKLAAKKLEIK